MQGLKGNAALREAVARIGTALPSVAGLSDKVEGARAALDGALGQYNDAIADVLKNLGKILQFVQQLVDALNTIVDGDAAPPPEGAAPARPVEGTPPAPAPKPPETAPAPKPVPAPAPAPKPRGPAAEGPPPTRGTFGVKR